MSDVAEVRHGCNSHVFRHVVGMNTEEKKPSAALDPGLCFTIVGSERTLDIMVGVKVVSCIHSR